MMHGQSQARGSRGFSFVEILVVLVIISILSTVAVLSYGNWRRDESISGAADKVKAAIVQARTRAIAEAHVVRLTFDFDRQMIWLDDITRFNELVPKVVHPELVHPDVVIEQVRVQGTTHTSGYAYAHFGPDGASEFLTVQLRRVDANTADDFNFYSIQMYPTSADPKVWPHERK